MKAQALALAVAVAGGLAAYALMGRPLLPAAPSMPPAALVQAQRVAARAEAEALARGEPRGLAAAAALWLEAGQPAHATRLTQRAVRLAPGEPMAWVAHGMALVAHAGGEVTPAARLALDRASRLAPDHPAPAYFLGLAWVQAGEPGQALAVWRALLAASPADAPWRGQLEERIAAVSRMEAAMAAARPG